LEEAIGEDANEKGMGSCNRSKEMVCTMKEESLSIVEGGKGGGERIHQRAVTERIYLTIKVTTDGASILCREEGWKEEDGPEL